MSSWSTRGPSAVRLVVVVALLAAGCGGESQGVEITEADDSPPSRTVRPLDPRAPMDTTYADSGLFADPSLQLDSLRADSLRRDSVRQDSLAQVPVAPDFRTFWPRVPVRPRGRVLQRALDGRPRGLGRWDCF